MKIIVGDITPEAIDGLEEQLGRILVTIMSSHFPQGQKNGHLPLILGQERSREVLADPRYLYVTPSDQGAYDLNTANQVNTAQRSQQEAVHNRKNKSHEVYL